MAVELTDAEAKVIAELLQRAKDEFSNHTCSDFAIDDLMASAEVGHEEVKQIIEAMWVDDRGPRSSWDDDTVEDYESEVASGYTDDWRLMGYFASKLRGDS